MGGKLIVFEGVEGCGKTTQLKATHDWLLTRINQKSISATQVVVTREPGGTDLGLELRRLLLEGGNIQSRAELLLYAADRSQHVEEFIQPHLHNGAIVLCDRYIDSTIAYQGYGRGLSLSLINQLNHLATGGLQSDVTLWLDIEVEMGLARTQGRGKADRMEQANLEFHRRVQQGYIELAKMFPERRIRVDASGSQDVVQGDIQKILSKWLMANG